MAFGASLQHWASVFFRSEFLCRFGGPWGSISEPFLTKLRVVFSRVFLLRFFEALGGPKRVRIASDFYPTRVNWAPPLGIKDVKDYVS